METYYGIANILEVQAEQYSDDAVYWNISYDDEYCLRVILTNEVKIRIEYCRLYDGVEIINKNKIDTIIEFAKINDININ